MLRFLCWFGVAALALSMVACGGDDDEGEASRSAVTGGGGGGGGGGAGAASAAEIRAYGELLCELNCVTDAECDDSIDSAACMSACEEGLDGPQPGLPNNPSSSCVTLARASLQCQIDNGCEGDFEACDDEARAYSLGC